MISAGTIGSLPALSAIAAAAWFIFRRPQTGLLLLAALTPLNGLRAIIPDGVVPAWWKEALLALTVAAAFVSPRVRRPSRLNVPWWPAIALLAVLGCVSAIVTLGALGRIPIKITFIYLAVVVVLWRTPFGPLDRDRLVSIIMVVGTLNAVVGILQQIVGASYLVDLGYTFGSEVRTAGPMLRSFGTFNQPFPYGLFLMMTLLVGLSVALAEPRRLRNRVFLWLVPVLLVGMAVSLVRASYLGFLVGLIWIGVIRYRKLLVVSAVSSAAVIPSIIPLVPRSTLGTVLSSDSFGIRAEGWGVAWGYIGSHPFGQGLGTAGAAAAKMAEMAGDTGVHFSDGILNRVDGGLAYSMGLPYQPDNYYVKMLVELGPIGLWLFVMILICAFLSSANIARRALYVADSGLAVGVGAMILATAAASFVSTYLEIFPMDVYTWLLLGTVGCIPLRDYETAANASSSGLSSFGSTLSSLSPRPQCSEAGSP